MSAPTDLALDGLAAQAGALRIYRQVFAVLAREDGAMIADSDQLGVDEAILGAFADAGTEGLTLEQVTTACRGFDQRLVGRRFEVLRAYGAISKVVERPHERFHRAAFAPYVMLLFLRRMAERGGQAELHQLLTLEGIGVRSPQAGPLDGHGSVRRLSTVFRLMANQLAGLASASPVEELRENAELLWGNGALIAAAQQVHATALGRWPQLDRDCAALRGALAAYGDASNAAAARLIEQAGSTRALGLLPVETWRTFARTAEAPTLSAVLDGVLFDAPAPWFAPQALAEALASSRLAGSLRTSPPRPASETGSSRSRTRAAAVRCAAIRRAGYWPVPRPAPAGRTRGPGRRTAPRPTPRTGSAPPLSGRRFARSPPAAGPTPESTRPARSAGPPPHCSHHRRPPARHATRRSPGPAGASGPARWHALAGRRRSARRFPTAARRSPAVPRRGWRMPTRPAGWPSAGRPY